MYPILFGIIIGIVFVTITAIVVYKIFKPQSDNGLKRYDKLYTDSRMVKTQSGWMRK